MGFDLATNRNPNPPEGFPAERFEELPPVRKPLGDNLAGDQLLIDRGTVRLHDQEQSASLPTIELNAHASVGIVVHGGCVVHPSGQMPEQGASLADRFAGELRSIHIDPPATSSSSFSASGSQDRAVGSDGDSPGDHPSPRREDGDLRETRGATAGLADAARGRGVRRARIRFPLPEGV